MSDVDALTKRALEKEAEFKAQFVKDKKKERQRRIVSEMMNARVHDIFQLADINADDVVVWIFRSKTAKGPDVQEGERVIAQILVSEQAANRIYWEECIVRANRYFLADGKLLAQELRQCTYNY